MSMIHLGMGYECGGAYGGSMVGMGAVPTPISYANPILPGGIVAFKDDYGGPVESATSTAAGAAAMLEAAKKGLVSQAAADAAVKFAQDTAVKEALAKSKGSGEVVAPAATGFLGMPTTTLMWVAGGAAVLFLMGKRR